MSCDRARRLFGACWDDELTHAEREWLDGHLAACPRCHGEYEAYSRALELAGTLPRIEAPPDMVERVLARTRHATTAPDVVGAPAARWVPVAAAAAAGLMVLVVAAMFVLPRSPWRGPASDTASTVAMARGGPAVPVLVSDSGTDAPATSAERPAGAPAAVADDPFDHSADVEFILDSVTLTRGRASVARTGSRRPGVEGEQAIISF